MARCETPIGRLPVLGSCPDDNELILFFGSATSEGMALRKWSTVKACIACSFFGPGVVEVPGTLFNDDGEYFNSALSNSLIVFYDGQPNMLRYSTQWTYITNGGNVIGIRIDPDQMPIDPAGMVYIIPNPIGCTSPQPSPGQIQALYNYSLEEVYEILRQVLFTGTPELYDNGGLHGTINMPRNFTKVRAMTAFRKYYLKES